MSGKLDRMIRKAQDMERRVEEIRRELGKRIFEGEAEGVVTVTVNGDHEVLGIRIDEDSLEEILGDSDRTEEIAELVRDAVNTAIQRSKTVIDAEMARATKVLSLPGI